MPTFTSVSRPSEPGPLPLLETHGGLSGGADRSPLAADPCATLLGDSDAMILLRQRLTRMAATDYPLLLLGETGTGKELVARAVHSRSARASGPFVPVNCGSLVATLLEAELFGIEDGTATGVKGRKGKFEVARGGTLFFDEIGELSRAGQVSLLRVLQERTVERVGSHRSSLVDVRVIAATHRDLDVCVSQHRFREDLLQRLRVLELRLPPLRERGDDILLLARAFLHREAPRREWTLGASARSALLAHAWPGNVRELEHAMQHVVALSDSDTVTADLLPDRLTPTRRLHLVTTPRPVRTLLQVIVDHVHDVLAAHGGNKTRACRELGIGYRTLQYYISSPTRHRAPLRWRRAA